MVCICVCPCVCRSGVCVWVRKRKRRGGVRKRGRGLEVKGNQQGVVGVRERGVGGQECVSYGEVRCARVSMVVVVVVCVCYECVLCSLDFVHSSVHSLHVVAKGLG